MEIVKETECPAAHISMDTSPARENCAVIIINCFQDITKKQLQRQIIVSPIKQILLRNTCVEEKNSYIF